jgi:hypothetical protein
MSTENKNSQVDCKDVVAALVADEEVSRWQRHIDECQSCAALQRTHRALSPLALPAVPDPGPAPKRSLGSLHIGGPGFSARLISGAQQRLSRRRQSRLRFTIGAGVFAMATTALLVVRSVTQSPLEMQQSVTETSNVPDTLNIDTKLPTVDASADVNAHDDADESKSASKALVRWEHRRQQLQNKPLPAVKWRNVTKPLAAYEALLRDPGLAP